MCFFWDHLVGWDEELQFCGMLLCPSNCSISGKCIRIYIGSPSFSCQEICPVDVPVVVALSGHHVRAEQLFPTGEEQLRQLLSVQCLCWYKQLLFPCDRTILPWFAWLYWEKQAEGVGVIWNSHSSAWYIASLAEYLAFRPWRLHQASSADVERFWSFNCFLAWDGAIIFIALVA